MGFTLGFSSGSTMGPVTMGGNRKVLRDHQGITEHVQSVQPGALHGLLGCFCRTSWPPELHWSQGPVC